MKKHLMIILLSSLVMAYACKGKKTETDTTAPATPTTTQPTTEVTPANAPSTAPNTYIYTVTATPDTVSLGKNQEAFIRLKDLKAIALTDPDGKSTGTELTYKIELTNKKAIGGNDIGIGTTDFRLELDNGNKIAPRSVYVSAAPDATNISTDDKFTIPPGAKPAMLNLFFDQTRASVKIEIK